MAERKLYRGDAAIGRAIKGLDGKINNLVATVSDIALSIIEHAAGPGNGDMSRALDLCKVVAKHRAMNVAFLQGYFKAFGRATVNLRANDGAGKVSLIKDGRFNVDGARANNWFEAVDDAGNRAPWYQGPTPAEFQPQTIGDIAEDFQRFVKREMDKIGGTKDVGGKVVPLVTITDEDRKQLDNAFQFISRIAATLARHENVQKLTQQLQAEQEAATSDEAVVEVLSTTINDNGDEQPMQQEQAVA